MGQTKKFGVWAALWLGSAGLSSSRSMLKLILIFGVLGLSSCGGTTPDPVPTCPVSRPTFRLTVMDSQGPLPLDGTLRIQHGAGCELYSLMDGSVSPCTAGERVGVLFCRATGSEGQLVGNAEGAGGAGGAGGTEARTIAALNCEVYTDGAATASFWSGAEELSTTDLTPERDACGTMTVDFTMDLAQKSPL